MTIKMLINRQQIQFSINDQSIYTFHRFIRETIANNFVNIWYVPTNKMIADM